MGTPETQHAATRRAIDVQVVALAILAALSGIALWLIVGQAVSRHNQADPDPPALYSLGFGPRTLLALTVTRTVVIGVAGAVVAHRRGRALPFLPRRLARQADLDPGPHVDGLVLLAGFAIVPLSLSRRRRSVPGGRVEAAKRRRPASASHRSHGWRRLPPVPVVGVRNALDRGVARRSVPVFATLVGATLGVATIVATLTFVASQDHFADTPSQFGVTWDIQTGDGFTTEDISGEVAEPRRRSRYVGVRGRDDRPGRGER